MGRVISIVGLILIISAGVLAAVSVDYETQLKKQQEISFKYIKNAKEALEKGDKQQAIKFIKMAIKSYPDNKEAYKLLEQIYKSESSVKETKPLQPTKPQKPAATEEEEEEELGC
ncbi:MAG: hypothetical protein GXN91_02035 [Epsilonproteobacteria bacterium]|nr:hypothetical protein [Campylobacterota bacterium]